MRFIPFIGFALMALSLSACKKEEAAAPPAAAEAPGTTAPAKPAEANAEITAPDVAEFNTDSVPVSTATLPPFPFFKVPDGLASVYDDKDKEIGFDRRFFIAKKKLVPVEGKVFRDMMNLSNRDTERKYSELEFQKNYENAITALGGKKISDSQISDEMVKEAGGRDAVEKYWSNAAPVPDYTHTTYLIRTADKEYWIHVSTGSFPVHGFLTVLEKEAMKQSLGFLDASAMKKALDTDGHVALYINFDIDKATLRPDSQSVIEEINKLLTSNNDLKLSIEGHTDSTGSADHNRTLSTSRARSVLGALVGLGVDPARLSSKGFGPDKPIAENANETGRVKNRRVELVKR
ncbi:MAG: OmpA family protein [Arenimonas sp.]